MMSIEIQRLNKYFGHFHALKDINLSIPTGELTALLGPSGCGKTTLLRIIAGLDYADSGVIRFSGEEVTHRHVRERNIGFMFQHYALFRHMNVFNNIAFGLQVQPRKLRPSREQIRDRVHELLKLVQLDWLANAYPSQLSGGQRQRVALARALATHPKLLLLDEPFGALDAKVRKELRYWLRKIHHSLGITSILVTHDQEEAIEMANQIVVMNHGVVEQSGTSEHLYHQPKNMFVTEFLGETNRFDEAYVEKGILHIGGYREQSHYGSERNMVAFIRTHDIRLSYNDSVNALTQAEIVEVYTVGTIVNIMVKAPEYEQLIKITLSPAEYISLSLDIGDKVWLHPRKLTVFRLPEMVEYMI